MRRARWYMEVSDMTSLPFAVGANRRFVLRCRYRYFNSFVLMLVLPLLPFILALGCTGIAWVWSRTIAKRRVFGLRLNIMAENSAQVREYLLGSLAKSLPFVHIIYNCICVRTFNTFSCFQLRDGTMVLWIAPDIVCWEGSEHILMVALSVISIIVYVLGIPAYVFCTMRYARQNDMLESCEWLKALGFLYCRYGTAPCSESLPISSQGGSHQELVILCRAGIFVLGARFSWATIRLLCNHGGLAVLSVPSIGEIELRRCCIASSATVLRPLGSTQVAGRFADMRMHADFGRVCHRHFNCFPIHSAVRKWKKVALSRRAASASYVPCRIVPTSWSVRVPDVRVLYSAILVGVQAILGPKAGPSRLCVLRFHLVARDCMRVLQQCGFYKN